MDRQQFGGLAALFAAAAFIFGFYIYIAVLGPAGYASPDAGAASHIAFLHSNKALITSFNFVIYIAFGAALVVLALALHQRTRPASPALADTALAFGLIWATLVIATGMVANIGIAVLTDLNASAPAQAASTWPAFSIVMNGLGGGNEIVGGLWILLVSLSATQPSSAQKALPRVANYLGIIVGISGLVTTIPALTDVGALFGIGSIVWFALVGAVLLRLPDARKLHDPV